MSYKTGLQDIKFVNMGKVPMILENMNLMSLTIANDKKTHSFLINQGHKGMGSR